MIVATPEQEAIRDKAGEMARALNDLLYEARAMGFRTHPWVLACVDENGIPYEGIFLDIYIDAEADRFEAENGFRRYEDYDSQEQKK